MSDFLRRFAPTAGAAAGVAALTQTAAYVASRKDGRTMVVDAAWGPGLAAIAVSSALVGDGDRTRRAVLAAGIGTWGTRLGLHLLQRVRSTEEEDPRYAEMLEGGSELTRVLKVFLGQAVGQWVVSLPLQVAAVSGPARGRARVITVVGALSIVGGLVVETLADRQKQAFKQRRDHDDEAIMREGLWAWSRHPNYFGDACVWNGAYLVAASAAPGAWTLASPAAMTYLLVWGSGAKPADERMKNRPGFEDYRREVSFFVPMPPRG